MIPLDLPELLYVDLSTNNLTTFPAVSGRALEYVIAGDNVLTNFEHGALLGATRLKELDLSESSFTRFDYSILKDCQSLEILKLQGNTITNFVDIKIPSLRKLFMSFNEISSFPAQFQSILPNLVELYLNTNMFATVNPNVFTNSSIRYLDLSFNPFRCDCDLVPFTNWMNTHKSVLLGPTTWSCDSPDEYMHDAITEAATELNCNQPQTQNPSLVTIVITAVVGCLFVAFSIYVITICVKSRRSDSNHQEHLEELEVRISSPSNCCLTNCYKFASFDDQRNLVSAVSSPSQKDAPTSL